jgi:integrase
VPGLCQRNGRYYALLWSELEGGRKASRRFPLLDINGLPAGNLTDANDALQRLRLTQRENKLPTQGHKPKFLDFLPIYLESTEFLDKRKGTQENERQALNRWSEYLGFVRVDQITPALIKSYIDKRRKGGVFAKRKLEPVTARTTNLELVALRNVLKLAVDRGHFHDLPKVKAQKVKKCVERRLVTPEEFERLIECARKGCELNGEQLADYLQFLAYSGAREQEALRIRWNDVDLNRSRVTIGADGLSKNHSSRAVEFNPKLSALLGEMYPRRAPDSSWLFPSPRRGMKDIHARSLRESLGLARKAADLAWVGFHDLRHMFCSVCVMAGVDFLTIAKWMGHKDGGILIGKVYGHLLDEHRQQAAKRVFA